MEDGDVPDLDDMTELVQEIKLRKQRYSLPINHEAKGQSLQTVETEEPKVEVESQGQEVNATAKPKEFGGMKKGFLFGSKSAPKVENEQSSIITPKVSAVENPLVLEEVQKAMKGATDVEKSWLTEDLLKQVVSNEKLNKQLADPRFAKAITWMQKDPKAAMEYYKNDADIQTFFKEFYMILGNHFTKLGDQQPRTSPSNSTISSEDEKSLQTILSNPEMKNILMKPDVQKLLELLRNNPEEGQKHLHANPSLRADVSKLVEGGVLEFKQS